MGEHGLERRNAGDAQPGEQRDLEPAAVLIGTLEVEVGGVAEFAFAEHGVPRRTRFEPHVEDVVALLERWVFRLEIPGAFRGQIGVFRCVVRSEKFRGRQLEPRVRAFGAHDICDGARDRSGHEALAVGSEKARDSQAPGALAADAPVGAGLEHAAHAVAAPFGNKRDVLRRCIERRLAERFGRCAGRRCETAFDTDEPLLGAAEDDGSLAAPIVRVAVRELVAVEEMAAVAEVIGDFLVRVPDGLAGQPLRNGRVVLAVVRDGAIHGKAFALSGLEILGAVAGRGVHESGAVFERDVFRAHEREDRIVLRAACIERG